MTTGCRSYDIPISSVSEQVNLSSVSPPNTPSVSPPFSCAFPPTMPFYAAIVASLPASSMTRVGSGGLRSWVWIGGLVDSVEAG